MSRKRGREDASVAMNDACKKGDLKEVQRLIRGGMFPDVELYWYWTPLQVASRYGNLEVVKYLVESGASIELVSKDGYSSLSRASFYGRLDVVKYILAHGATFDFANEKPLKVARSTGKLTSSSIFSTTSILRTRSLLGPGLLDAFKLFKASRAKSQATIC